MYVLAPTSLVRPAHTHASGGIDGRHVVITVDDPLTGKLAASDNSKSEAHFMNIIIWLVVGGLIGWVASVVMRTDGQQGLVLNVVVGIVGAFLGGWLLSPLVGVSTINQSNFSVAGLLVSLVGAAILLAIVNLVRRGAVR
jgi:uncharacterized membrane protein YeaQ/YmgE (transglycosylase-associated protein family)